MSEAGGRQGRVLRSPPLDVFGQMALDEALAQARPEAFCIRFYRWQGPGATFGYAQRFAEVQAVLPAELLERATRRPTGGGIVRHVDDLTFSCLIPAEGVYRPMRIYQRLHGAILEGLRAAGLEARLCDRKDSPAPQGPGGASQCFVEPVAMDVLVGEHKILGGAIRRYRDTVLYQGSLQVPGARERARELEAAILNGLSAITALDWNGEEIDPEVAAAAQSIEPRYHGEDWKRKR